LRPATGKKTLKRKDRGRSHSSRTKETKVMRTKVQRCACCDEQERKSPGVHWGKVRVGTGRRRAGTSNRSENAEAEHTQDCTIRAGKGAEMDEAQRGGTNARERADPRAAERWGGGEQAPQGVNISNPHAKQKRRREFST